MTRKSCRGVWIPLMTLLLALASHARGDEQKKTYRWVGEDGHVYTSTTPPPNGRGIIETQSAAPPAKAKSPAAKPAAGATPPRSIREILSGNAASATAPAQASADGDGNICGRSQSWVDQWRLAARSLESAEESLDRLQSDTDDYVRRNDSYYEKQLESAEDRVTRAQDRQSQVEDDAKRAGVPQICFTQ